MANAHYTTDGEPPDPDRWDAAAPKPLNPKTGQHGAYYVLPESERAKGFVRPYRNTYKHLVCGAETLMPRSIAETYARNPHFYGGGTFCYTCRDHFPAGEDGEFVWKNTEEKVGT